MGMANRQPRTNLVAYIRRAKMAQDKNFVTRAFDALMAGRERQAQLYVERFDRDYGKLNRKLTKR
jgi:hypothetical protein